MSVLIARRKGLPQASALRLCGKSTLTLSFPQYIIFKMAHSASSYGVVSVHRKRNLPAEGSRIEAFQRIGNEAQDSSEEVLAADVITEVQTTRGATRGCRANPRLRYCDLDVEPDLQKIRPIGRLPARDAALSHLCAQQWATDPSDLHIIRLSVPARSRRCPSQRRAESPDHL